MHIENESVYIGLRGYESTLSLVAICLRGYESTLSLVAIGLRGYESTLSLVAIGLRGYESTLSLVAIGLRGYESTLSLVAIGLRGYESTLSLVAVVEYSACHSTNVTHDSVVFGPKAYKNPYHVITTYLVHVYMLPRCIEFPFTRAPLLYFFPLEPNSLNLHLVGAGSFISLF